MRNFWATEFNLTDFAFKNFLFLGLIRVREFTMAEIEHFLDPEDKSHPKFDSIKDVEVSLYSACCQMEGKSVYKTTIGKAVGEKTIDNQTLGYFIARFVFYFQTHSFLF